MKFAVIAVPAAPVRKKPNHRREMVNQLLFGEAVKVLQTKGELWVKIRSLHDGYEGWLTNTLLEPVDEKFAYTRCKHVTADLMSLISLGDKKINIPLGSSLLFFIPHQNDQQDGKGKLGSNEYLFTGNYYKRNEQIPCIELLRKLTLPWLNAPYLWGGRTILGVDCSGFVQVIYKLMGIDLPRDAWQQAQQGKSIKKLIEAQPGDLAFFNDKEEIVHVGILMDNEQIIHASGRVKIDTINKKGIVNIGTKTKLKLRSVRRITEFKKYPLST